MNKLLTIVIPVYNTEKYLVKCFESLVVPEFISELDILVIIDGSPDNSLKIAREYELKYPQAFRVINKENGGHGSCCNVGLKEAKGKYIRFLDSDDWFDEKGFPEFLSVIKNIDADLIQTNSIIEYMYKGTQKREELFSHCSDVLWQVSDFDFTPFRYFITLSNSTFKTDILRAAHIHFTEKAMFDDTPLYLEPFRTIQTLYCLDLYVYHYFIGRPGQSIGAITELKMSHRKHEFIKLFESYNSIRNTLSTLQIEYLDNFLNQIIANEYYMYSTFLPYKSAKSVVGEWNTLLSKYSFLIVEKIPCKRRYTCYSFTLFWLYTHTKLWLKHLL